MTTSTEAILAVLIIPWRRSLVRPGEDNFLTARPRYLDVYRDQWEKEKQEPTRGERITDFASGDSRRGGGAVFQTTVHVAR